MKSIEIPTNRVRGSIGVVLLVAALSALSIAGAASTGHAAASPGVKVDPITYLQRRGFTDGVGLIAAVLWLLLIWQTARMYTPPWFGVSAK